MLKKFQDFAIKGNASIWRSASSSAPRSASIVDSLVGDIFMPVVGAVTGGLDFTNYFSALSSKVTADIAGRGEEAGRGAGVGQLHHHHRSISSSSPACCSCVVNLIQKLRQQEEDEAAGRAAAPGGAAGGNPRPAGEESDARANHCGSAATGTARGGSAAADTAVAMTLHSHSPHVIRVLPMRCQPLRLPNDATHGSMHAYLPVRSQRSACVIARTTIAANGHAISSPCTAAKSSSSTTTRLMRDTLSAVLAPEGCRVTCFAEGHSFLAAARARTPACILLDVNMPDRSGLDMLRELDAPHYPAPILIVSGQRDVPTAVNAIKGGALDFIEKPFDAAAVIARVREAIAAWARRAENERRRHAVPRR